MLYAIIVGGDSGRGRLANNGDLLLGLGGCINYDNGSRVTPTLYVGVVVGMNLILEFAADNTRRPVLLKSLTQVKSVKYEAFSVVSWGQKGENSREFD